MYKFIITVMIIIGIGYLSAADDIMTAFMEYNQNPTEENLIKALEYYHTNKEEQPDDYYSSLLLSYIHYMELNNYIRHLNDNIDSLEVRTQFQFANLLLSLNQYDQSLEIYDLITDRVPQWSCAWRHKGEAYYYAGELEEAELALNESIRTRIEHYDAYVWLSFVQKELGRYSEALETLETGLTYYGKDIEDPDEEVDALDVKFLLLELYDKNDRTEDYENLQDILLKEAPEDPRWDGVTELQDV